MTPSATILSIERTSLHDGPGIRTTVFLKGCPLSCLWCHNPESRDFKPVLAYQEEKCSFCGRCVNVCKQEVHFLANGIHTIDRSRCDSCGACVETCTRGALQIKGKSMTVAEVMGTVLKDKRYYDNSGGGLTVSGGEPMSQFDFTLALLQSAGEEGVHRCLETSGAASADKYREIISHVDLFLFDWKESNPSRHREYTGTDSQRILSNLKLINESDTPVILRCPIIPSLNDREDHFQKIAELAEEFDCITSVELMPYHPLGASKSRLIGEEYPIPDIDFAGEDEVKKWKKQITERTGKEVL